MPSAACTLNRKQLQRTGGAVVADAGVLTLAVEGRWVLPVFFLCVTGAQQTLTY
jgi:hypothetical protein